MTYADMQRAVSSRCATWLTTTLPNAAIRFHRTGVVVTLRLDLPGIPVR